ncbi:MAG: hypothetical protein QM785_12010 [Pyrinomonadaceae bacterium]
MAENKIDPEQAYRTLLIIWAALVVSQFFFIVILFVLRPALFKFEFTQPLIGSNPVIILIGGAIAVSNLFLSFIFKKRFLDQSVNEQNVGLVQTAMIAACALCESISMIGLVAAFIANYQYFFIFFALGILGMLFHMPKRNDIHAATFKK